MVVNKAYRSILPRCFVLPRGFDGPISTAMLTGACYTALYYISKHVNREKDRSSHLQNDLHASDTSDMHLTQDSLSTIGKQSAEIVNSIKKTDGDGSSLVADVCIDASQAPDGDAIHKSQSVRKDTHSTSVSSTSAIER